MQGGAQCGPASQPTTFPEESVHRSQEFKIVAGSVADPDPEDPYVLGLPDPDPLVRDTDPDPSITSKNSKKNIDSYWYDFLSLKNDVNVPSKSNKQINLEKGKR